MISIRLAVQSDAWYVTRLMRYHRSEVKTCDSLTFDFIECVTNVEKTIIDDGHFILVAHDESSDKLIGYIWVSLVQPHFSHQYYMTEHYTYVLPEHRTGRAFKKLLNEANVISKLTGCSYFQIACISGVDACTRSYDKRFTKVGGVYHYKEGK